MFPLRRFLKTRKSFNQFQQATHLTTLPIPTHIIDQKLQTEWNEFTFQLIQYIDDKIDDIPRLIQVSLSEECPSEIPNFGDICAFEGKCDYGTESCCGKTFTEITCNCLNGTAECFHLDACLGGCGECFFISVICPDGTELSPDPDNNCGIPDCPPIAIDTSCPLERPNALDYCTFEGDCDYGEESCCGNTFPSIRCKCNNNQALCFYFDLCLGGCP